MSRGFGHTKRRVAQAKKQKREEKRLKKLNKNLVPVQSVLTDPFAEPFGDTLPPEETPPAEIV